MKFNKPIETIIEAIRQQDLNDYLAKNLTRFGFYVAPYDKLFNKNAPYQSTSQVRKWPFQGGHP